MKKKELQTELERKVAKQIKRQQVAAKSAANKAPEDKDRAAHEAALTAYLWPTSDGHNPSGGSHKRGGDCNKNDTISNITMSGGSSAHAGQKIQPVTH